MMKKFLKKLTVMVAAISMAFAVPTVSYAYGTGTAINTSGTTYTVRVATGYLALRTAMAYDSRNEIGAMYTGETVQVQNTNTGTEYWYVYSPKLGKSGYCNSKYLVGGGGSYSSGGSVSTGGTTYTVRVATGYLALRTAMAYDYSNEIGAMYTGETVQVQNTNTGTEYWYVYSPKLGKSGYCNSKYLVGGGGSYSGGGYSGSSSTGGATYTVSVATGYLALRTAMAYDSRNEIGAMYSGETVQVQNTNTGTEYWYVYSPKLGKSGYCNSKYLIGGGGSYSGGSSSSGMTRTVSVATGYLALRTAMAYDDSNEIGAMYSGETVQVQNTNTGTEYWYVYSPKLGKSGYCNSKYLR
ncbi:MAG: hypothetical protein Q4B26_14460 [Eubacteriales bacterium]|nr:hypothetical protein [Eubacteriales bacterium]